MGGKSGGGGSAPSGYPTVGMYDPAKAAELGLDPMTGLPLPKPFEFPSFHMPQQQSSEDYGAQLEAQRQADLRTSGENDRDTLYSDYMSAAGSATDYINTQVDQERANAALLGIEYNLDDEGKGTRISDYFASIWGEGDQSRLEGLMKKWGNPSGFDGFNIVRGDGSKVKGTDQVEAGKGTTYGQRPSLIGEEEVSEEDLLGSTSILGGA